MRNQPFRRCYCGRSARFEVSSSMSNPGRRYFSCKHFLDEKEDCTYFEWYDDELSNLWYKEKMRELMSLKSKKSTVAELSSENPLSDPMFLIRGLVVLVMVLILLVVVLMMIW
ncbi:hypothetical protein LXL04_017457 [Taraxacum kok-saghyz]